MINEEISEILNRDLTVSTERGIFSAPSEITQHVNSLLDAAYSTRTISAELQEIGWQKCGTSRAKRKHDNRAQCYYWKQNRKQKALLSPSAKTNTQSEPQSNDSPHETQEPLSSIERRFRSARADKERSLASTRSVEVSTSKVKRDHLEIQLAKERGELISVEEVKRTWEAAIVYMKTNLYTLPERLSQRWASEESEDKIYEEFIKELDALLNRFASDGDRVIAGENEEDFATDESTDAENDARR